MRHAIEALKGRDHEAWRAMYEEYVDGVYQHALYRVGGDREVAEEVTQEVFVRAIESIDSFRGEGTGLLRWLRGISRRVIAQRARNLKPAAAHPSSLDWKRHDEHSGGRRGAVDSSPAADEELVSEEERRLTGAALTALPSRWEEALRWKYCDELSVAEIGKRLGISEKAAESLLSRARSAFRTTYFRLLKAGNRRAYKVEEWSDE